MEDYLTRQAEKEENEYRASQLTLLHLMCSAVVTTSGFQTDAFALHMSSLL